jgi:RND family efflux transporter MFP subunit
MSKRLLFALLSLAAVSLRLVAAPATGAPAVPRAALTVRTITPVSKPWPETITATGGLFPWHEAVIAAETGALRILRLNADVGDQVKKGSVLAELDQDSVRADVAQQEALVAQAKAALTEAHANGARARSLKGGSSLSEQQVDKYLAAEQTASANLAAAQARLDVQRIRLAQTRILAPDDGVISARSAALGMVVQPGTELFRLIRGNRIEWRAEVTAEALSRIRPGQNAQVQLPGGQTVSGRVRIVAPTFDPASRRTLVYVDLPPGSPARAGMFARGQIQVGERPALSVPESAVILRDGYSYVFQVGPDQSVAQRQVVTGRRMGDRVEIARGLEPDAAVVQTGGAFLNDGDRVRVVP